MAFLILRAKISDIDKLMIMEFGDKSGRRYPVTVFTHNKKRIAEQMKATAIKDRTRDSQKIQGISYFYPLTLTLSQRERVLK